MTILVNEIKEKFSGYIPVGEHGYRHFSILIPIVSKSGSSDKKQVEPHLLYEVRASRLDRQPGEVCFPGGLIEEGESPMECAIRETEEELGIDRSGIEIISEIDSVCSTSGSQIHCFLGSITPEAFENMVPSEDEVAEVFTVSVGELMNMEPEMYTNRLRQEPDPDFPYGKVTDGKMYPWRSGTAPVPVYETGERIIWGLTGRITKQFVEVLKCSD